MMLAWKRIKKARARMWGEWMTIGEGLLEGRRWAMQQAGTNHPEGKGYVMAYAEWLRRYQVDDMDKSDRAKLLQLMEDRPGVEEWRATLTDSERNNLNNPTIAWRKWTAATRVQKPKPRTAGASATEYGRAQATVEQLQARVSELEEELEATPRRPKATLDDWCDLFMLEISKAAHALSPAEKTELYEVLIQAAKELKEQEDTPDPEQGLQWTGDEDDGFLGLGCNAAFTVTWTLHRGCQHFEARTINPDADLSMPVKELAESYGSPFTHKVKNRRGGFVTQEIDPYPEADEAKALCERVYAQQ